MQAQGPEGVTEGELQGFRHVALPRVRGPDPVAQVCVLGGTANDLVQVDGAEDGPVLEATDQELLVSATPRRGHPVRELPGRGAPGSRPRLPPPEQPGAVSADDETHGPSTARRR